MEFKSSDRIALYIFTVATVIVFAVFAVLNQTVGGFFTAAMIVGTVAYHLVMRLAIGFIFTAIPKKARIYAATKPYVATNWELKFYSFIKLKKWKKWAFTFNKSLFAVNRQSFKELCYQMKKAQLIHVLIFILGFVTLLFTLFCDEFFYFYVFLATALFSVIFDLISIILQRYNLRRLYKILDLNKEN